MDEVRSEGNPFLEAQRAYRRLIYARTRDEGGTVKGVHQQVGASYCTDKRILCCSG
jgi:hypothetical protein